jgi:hypothetical protein
MPLFDRELVVLMRTALDDVLGIAVIVGCGRPQHPIFAIGRKGYSTTWRSLIVALRRQRSHVRIVSGAPIDSTALSGRAQQLARLWPTRKNQNSPQTHN